MKLNKLYISGYKSVSTVNPQVIEFDKNVTTFIGHNGTGKSTALEALNKLFATDHSLRSISPSDFYLSDEDDKSAARNLVIEAWFNFDASDGNISIPALINGLTATSNDGEIIFRVRLEASLSFDYNPLGDVDEKVWIIDGDMENPEEDNKHRLSAVQRNGIQVHYVPANRDPLIQLKYSSKAVLGRLLRAIKWQEDEQAQFETQAQELNKLTIENPALVQITSAINDNWQSIYKGQHLNEATLNFPVGDIDEILKLIQLQFMPDATGNKVETSRLSDGQKSLVYFALTKALFEIDKTTRNAVAKGEDTNFDPEKMKLPIFSLIALEEPENHLSPHYLGRIIKLVKEYGDSELCQAIVSTHSPSLVGRVEPNQIRHFRLDTDTKSTHIQSLTLPGDADEQAKYISEAVKAYPEIYFAKLVVLGEGDSEQVIIPKLLEFYETDIDSHAISVVPLGGRHVNHFWRLLNALKIPFVTLLDFDIDRNGGGFGRINYCVEQLSKFKPDIHYLHTEILDQIPAWNSPANPASFCIDFQIDETSEIESINIVSKLEENNVFFSSPLDIDYSMICAFPDIFCEKDNEYGERGPVEGKEDEEDADNAKRKAALIKAVLKKGNSGMRYAFGDEWERNFLWYRYRFLSNKSKPASHVRMILKIEDKYDADEIKAKLPPELTRLMNKIIDLAEQVIE
ncbi:AAA family ATPase [Pseudoalteromonas sp. 2CM39R]|uniref:AAA family ATPase n=1 Tax=Pseudoalteromonas sp. 2CM39R TaxID=2929856 RepID=UPI0020BD48A1|nr:AAA family ATPase [Pseudoalteromonas sp. 2CM39R]MCK8126152.1 AAA family ATPase [Pseudoalteromonas sp. 2CM39R]